MENKKSMYLFNICETDNISFRTVLQILRCSNNNEIDEHIIKKVLGDTPTSFSVIKAYDKIDTSFLSLYSLCLAGINIYVIEQLRHVFSSISDLCNNSYKMNACHLQERTKIQLNKIIQNYQAKILNENDQMCEIIMKIIEENDSIISIDSLFSKCLGLYSKTTTNLFYSSLEKLVENDKISTTAEGVKKKRISISAYFNILNSNRSLQILKQRINDITIIDLAKKFNVSKQRIDQIVKFEISKMPEFNNEKSYMKILSQYKLSPTTLKAIGHPDILLSKYVLLKYHCKPKKTEVDFVIDNHFERNEFGEKILLSNKWCMINNEIVKYEFKSLFKKFIELSSIKTFSLIEIIPQYSKFLLENNLPDNPNKDKQDIFARQIENTNEFINCGNKNFYWFNIDTFSNEFLLETAKYLDSFYGYGSVAHFFDNHKKLCLQHGIKNEKQLFPVLKYLYKDSYKDVITFLRNPSIYTTGLSRDDFFHDLIAEKQPIDRLKFFSFLESTYGFNNTTLLWNSSTWFGKYLNIKDQLVLNDVPFPAEDGNVISQFLEGKVIISMDLYKKRVKHFFPKSFEIFLKPFNIRRLGYKYTTSSIYLARFSSLEDAYKYVCTKLPFKIEREKILSLMPESCVKTSRYQFPFKECYFIQYSVDNYLNTLQLVTINRENIIDFRNKIIYLLDPNKIYTLIELLDSPLYYKCCTEFFEVKKLINSLGNTLLINILKSSTEITSDYNHGHFVFSKGIKVNNKSIIKYIIHENGSIDKNTLKSVIFDEYGLATTLITSGNILSMGCYYNTATDKIYESKERSDKEMILYLTREEKENELD